MHYTEASMLVIQIPYVLIHALKCFALLKFCRMVTFLEYCRNLGQVITYLTHVFTFQDWIVTFLPFFQQLKSNFAAYNLIMVVFCYVFFVHLITCTSIFIDTHKTKFSVKEYYHWRYAESPPLFFHNYCVNLFRAVVMINNINYGLDPLTAVTRIYIAFTWIVSKIITIFIIGKEFQNNTPRVSWDKYGLKKSWSKLIELFMICIYLGYMVPSVLVLREVLSTFLLSTK